MEPFAQQDDEDASAPLLSKATESSHDPNRHGHNATHQSDEPPLANALTLRSLGAESLVQTRLATPLMLNYMCMYGISIINLSFAGHLGTQQLASVALGNTLVGIVARLVMTGLCGGLDTQASQVRLHGSSACE